MNGVKIDGQFLDLFSNTGFDFQLTSPAYFGGSSDVIQNSLVFSVKVPNTPRNAALLRHAHHASNAYPFLEKEYAELWADGGLFFAGDLTVTEAAKDYFSFRLLINAASALKTLLLKELDFETAVDMGNTPLAFAKNTALNPLTYNFIFFPVFNKKFAEKENAANVEPAYFQNYYDVINQNFTTESPVTPFLRLDYILRKTFEKIGFSVVNRFQTTDELKRLVLYNNYDARIQTFYPSVLNLKNHVPQSLKCGEFLNKFSRLFNVCPFIDAFGKTVELYPMIDAMKEAAAYDWSDKMLTEWRLEQEDLNIPKRIGYKDPFKVTGEVYRYEQSFENIPYTPIADVRTLTNTDQMGIYFEYTTDTYYKVYLAGSDVAFHELTKQFTPLSSKTAKGEPFYNDMLAALNEEVFIHQNNLEVGSLPFFKIEGSNAEKTNEPPLLVMLYRGMHPCLVTYPSNAAGPNYPYASANVYTTLKARMNTEKFSLNFDGDYGLGRNCIGDWYDMLQAKKDLIARFNLTVAELRSFSFRKKVHINGMDYFVKTIKGKLTSRGLSPVEAELVKAVL